MITPELIAATRKKGFVEKVVKNFIEGFELRKYQERMFADLQNHYENTTENRAQIYAPTGAGKTVVFTAFVKYLLRTRPGIKILFVHPRIALSQDQHKRITYDLPDVEHHFFHSGGKKDYDVVPDGMRVNQCSTDPKDVKHWLRSAKGEITIFTTYDSASKIAHLFDVVIFDEGHYLTESENSKIIDKVLGRAYLFTATPITKNWGASMDDESKFGRVITEVTPKELIAGGYMVSPKFIRADIQLSDYDPDSDTVAVVSPYQAIAYAARSAKEELRAIGWNGPVKLLVAMSSTQPFKTEIEDFHSEMEGILGAELNLYTIAAGRCWASVSGVNTRDRKKTIDHMAASTNDCVIVHCDTLSEGIDVDGLNAFFPLRDLSKPKFIQTYGRCARPANEDKIGIEVVPYEQRLKKHAIIIIPVINGHTTVFNKTSEWLEQLTQEGYAEITHKVESNGDITWGISDDEEDEITEPKLRVTLDIERFETEIINLLDFYE